MSSASSSSPPRAETSAALPTSDAVTAPITIRTLAKWRREDVKFAALTCYDATTARWLERAGVPVLLVGDTAAEVILGHPATLHAPLEFMITLTAAVKRGGPSRFVMADMPFLSYGADEAEGIRNAGRFMTEGHADAVKLEVDRRHAALVEKMGLAGIPVVAHIGSRPQHTRLRGGYWSAGKTAETARDLLEDARILEEAGAAMLLVEACPAEVAEEIVARSALPVIGCGAGPACHGQVVVLQDLLGLTDWQPAFATPAARIGDAIVQAASTWCARVAGGDLGPHPYSMSDEQLAAFRRSIGS
ncbi:MAG: 3-methyl-2-oxobutanoate hydroxymethyltransferase [Planctomycetota bacterium]|jgi:3-methyl-2-oxobutanoate hydroxymethyltransferase